MSVSTGSLKSVELCFELGLDHEDEPAFEVAVAQFDGVVTSLFPHPPSQFADFPQLDEEPFCRSFEVDDLLSWPSPSQPCSFSPLISLEVFDVVLVVPSSSDLLVLLHEEPEVCAVEFVRYESPTTLSSLFEVNDEFCLHDEL